MYIDYFKKEVQKHAIQPTPKQIVYFKEFMQNLQDGIEYYGNLFPQMVEETAEYRQKALDELAEFKKKVENFIAEQDFIFGSPHSPLVPATA